MLPAEVRCQVSFKRRTKPTILQPDGEPVAAAATNNTNTNTIMIFVQRSAGTHSLTDKSAGIVFMTVGEHENVACFRVIFDYVPYDDNIFGIKTANTIYYPRFLNL